MCKTFHTGAYQTTYMPILTETIIAVIGWYWVHNISQSIYRSGPRLYNFHLFVFTFFNRKSTCFCVLLSPYHTFFCLCVLFFLLFWQHTFYYCFSHLLCQCKRLFSHSKKQLIWNEFQWIDFPCWGLNRDTSCVSTAVCRQLDAVLVHDLIPIWHKRPLRMFCRLYASEPGYITLTSIFTHTHNKISHNQNQDQNLWHAQEKRKKQKCFTLRTLSQGHSGSPEQSFRGFYPQRNQHLVIGWAGINCTYNRPTFDKWSVLCHKKATHFSNI